MFSPIILLTGLSCEGFLAQREVCPQFWGGDLAPGASCPAAGVSSFDGALPLGGSGGI